MTHTQRAQKAQLSPTIEVILPASGISVKIHPVWTKAAGASITRWCTGELVEGDPDTIEEWRHLVDSVN